MATQAPKFKEGFSYFNLPDFYKYQNIYRRLWQLAEAYPDIFRDKRQVLSFYGCFPGMDWNGGRPYFGEKLDIPTIEKYLKTFKDENYGIPLTFTFTNSNININDTYMNKVLNLIVENEHRIMVSGVKAASYIATKFGSSVCLGKSIIGTSWGFLTNDLIYFDFVVPSKSYNKKFLEEPDIINDKDKLKVELMANDHCCDCCKTFFEHHKHVSLQQTGHISKFNNYDCPNKTDFPFRAMETNSYNILPDDIDKYVEKGFQVFKLVGRENPIFAIQGIIKYFVKPEFQDDVRLHLLEAFYG